jgi:DNA polymerase III sliding clamp (beta) subunit (PCNA family)
MPDYINDLKTQAVELSFLGEIKTITIKNTEDDGLIQLVVPIRTY